jgi:hypothetical protein
VVARGNSNNQKCVCPLHFLYWEAPGTPLSRVAPVVPQTAAQTVTEMTWRNRPIRRLAIPGALTRVVTKDGTAGADPKFVSGSLL